MSTNNKIRAIDEFPFPSKDPGFRDYYGRDLECYLDRYCPGLTKQELDELLTSQGITKTVFDGRDSPVIRGLSSLDVLHICLLKTEPFHFDGALGNLSHTIQDVRNRDKLLCEDRPKLLASLAEALASFQNQYAPITSRTDMRVVYTQLSIRKIGNFLNTCFDLRSRGIIRPKSDTKSQQRKTVMRAHETIVKFINALKPEDYTEIARYFESKQSKNEVKRELITEMWNCFEKYGPKWLKKDATYHAIAAILRHFEIENGSRSTIAQRIRKRLQRA